MTLIGSDNAAQVHIGWASVQKYKAVLRSRMQHSVSHFLAWDFGLPPEILNLIKGMASGPLNGKIHF